VARLQFKSSILTQSPFRTVILGSLLLQENVRGKKLGRSSIGRVSAEMSVKYQPRCWSSIGRDVDRDVSRISADLSVEYRPRCRSSISPHVGGVSAETSVECRRGGSRDVGRVSAEKSVEYWPRYRPSVGRDVGRVSAEISVKMSVEYQGIPKIKPYFISLK